MLKKKGNEILLWILGGAWWHLPVDVGIAVRILHVLRCRKALNSISRHSKGHAWLHALLDSCHGQMYEVCVFCVGCISILIVLNKINQFY